MTRDINPKTKWMQKKKIQNVAIKPIDSATKVEDGLSLKFEVEML